MKYEKRFFSGYVKRLNLKANVLITHDLNIEIRYLRVATRVFHDEWGRYMNPCLNVRLNVTKRSSTCSSSVNFSNNYLTMKAFLYTVIVALIVLDIHRVSSLSCPYPCWDCLSEPKCCDSGEYAKDKCGCCNMCAKVVCQCYMPLQGHCWTLK